MPKHFSAILVTAVLVCLVGCANPIPYTQAFSVNQGDNAVEAFRIDRESVVLHRNISGFGRTFMLLERSERGVRYTISADRYVDGEFDRSCRGQGFFYDTEGSLANFDLIGNDRVLVITAHLQPLIDRWNEVLRECR